MRKGYSQEIPGGFLMIQKPRKQQRFHREITSPLLNSKFTERERLLED